MDSSHADQTETILEALFEGGSLTVLGIKTDNGWRFKITTDEGTLISLLSEEDAAGLEPRHETAWVDSWETALALLNERWWHMTSPRQVHPDFRQRIWTAVQERAGCDRNPHRWTRWHLSQWRSACGQRQNSGSRDLNL
jgi:hypothetical protein